MEGLRCTCGQPHTISTSQQRGFSMKQRKLRFRDLPFTKRWTCSTVCSQVRYLNCNHLRPLSLFSTCPSIITLLQGMAIDWDLHKESCVESTFQILMSRCTYVASRHFLLVQEQFPVTLNCTISSGLMIGKYSIQDNIVIRICPLVPRTTGNMQVRENKMHPKCMGPEIILQEILPNNSCVKM